MHSAFFFGPGLTGLISGMAGLRMAFLLVAVLLAAVAAVPMPVIASRLRQTASPPAR